MPNELFKVRHNQDDTFTIYYGEDMFDWFNVDDDVTIGEIAYMIEIRLSKPQES